MAEQNSTLDAATGIPAGVAITPPGQKNIGTTDAPLLVPVGSPADLAYTKSQESKNFTVPPPDTFAPSITASAFAANAPTADTLRTDLSQKEDLQKQLTDNMTPTAVENELNKNLVDLRGKIDQAGLDEATRYITNANRPILTDVAVGQANATKQLDELKIQGLKLTESNLMQRLGLEQGKRQGVIDTIKTKLGFAQDKFNTHMQIADKIDQQQRDLLARTDKLADNARLTLASVIEKFNGLDINDLDAATQNQLAHLASGAGVPFNLLIEGMKVAKNAAMAKVLNDQMTPDLKEYNVAKNQGFKGSFLDWQKINANLKAPRTTINYNQGQDQKVKAALQEVGPAIDAIKGSDGYVNPYALRDLYSRFIQKNPGSGKDFMDQYLPFINPRDKNILNIKQ